MNALRPALLLTLSLALLSPRPATACDQEDCTHEAAEEGALPAATAAPEAPASVAEAWEPLLKNPGMAAFFDGIFVDLGVRVQETGEELTIHHMGDHFTLEEGIDAGSVDYTVPIRLENVSNLASHGADEMVDRAEAYAILDVMFTPMTQVTLAASPVIRSKKLRRAAGVEALIHVELLDASGEVGRTHTLAFVEEQWLVIPGLHGEAQRVFHMTPEDAAVYQRHIFAATKTDTNKGWMQFARWYNEWRESVSTVP